MSTHENTKVALVTGASRGIGAAVARRLAQDGFAVAVNYSSSPDQAHALVAVLQAEGLNAMAVQADVASSAQVQAMFDAVEQQLGRIVVLVNNAGMLKPTALAETSDQLYDQTFDLNVRGTFNTLRIASSRMPDGGRIINLSSTAIALNLPGYGIYNATKAAVECLTKVLANELRGRSITVNAVAPGPVATELFLNGKSPEEIQKFAHMSPLQRLGQPEDIASIVSFLAGPDGAWVNGQVLRANGGLA